MRTTLSILLTLSLAVGLAACDSGDEDTTYDPTTDFNTPNGNNNANGSDFNDGTSTDTNANDGTGTNAGDGTGTNAGDGTGTGEGDATCSPSCVGKMCGSDGCGGLCGNCGAGSYCDEASSQCVEGTCTPSCVGKMCGTDGCGGLCGQCSDGQTCTDGMCADDSAGGGTGSPGTPGTSESLDCMGVLNCANACGQDEACIDACINSATPDAAAALGALNQCLGTACPTGDATCLQNALGTTCGAEFAACQNGTAPGGGSGTTPGGSTGGTCLDILGCFDTCGPNDQQCLQNCVAAGSPEGQQALLALNECLVNACPNDDSQECAQNAIATTCAAEASACQNGGSGSGAGSTPGASGSGTCLGILQCFGTCGENDQACLQACVAAASPAAQQTFIELNDCLAAACPDVNDATCGETALQTTCAGALMACQNG